MSDKTVDDILTVTLADARLAINDLHSRLAERDKEIERLKDEIIELEIQCGRMDLTQASLERMDV